MMNHGRFSPFRRFHLCVCRTVVTCLSVLSRQRNANWSIGNLFDFLIDYLFTLTVRLGVFSTDRLWFTACRLFVSVEFCLVPLSNKKGEKTNENSCCARPLNRDVWTLFICLVSFSFWNVLQVFSKNGTGSVKFWKFPSRPASKWRHRNI